MRPSARVDAIIELIGEIDTGTAPADRVLERYFRRARFAGSKDRKALREGVYGVLRHRGRLDWWLERLNRPATPRLLVLAHGLLLDGLDGAAIAALFDGSTYGPEPLDDDETALAATLAGQTVDHAEMPDWVRLECPEWLYAPLSRDLGDGARDDIAALNQAAPVDFRINPLKADRQTVIDALAKDGIAAHPGPHSPWGLRMDAPLRLAQTAAFKGGMLEVQDEGSQLLALLTDAKPGMCVVDFCAGAGGKTLALAAAMADQGVIHALDVAEARLARMTPRLARAGIAMVRVGEAPAAGSADRVLVDAPCSGIGRWRRAPEERWRLTQAGLDRLTVEQAKILNQAAALVAPGGRLIYATCSLLARENRDQVDAFLAGNGQFRRLSVDEIWAAHLAGPCPSRDGDLLLSPIRSQTDGYYMAVLQRQDG